MLLNASKSDRLLGDLITIFCSSQLLQHSATTMAEALVVLGATAAVCQLIDYGLKIISLCVELRSKMKNKWELVHHQMIHIEQLIALAQKIQQDHSQEISILGPVKSCLQEAVALHDILCSINADASQGFMRRFGRVVKWKTKEKEILQICARVEVEKAALSLSMTSRMARQLSAVHDQFPELRCDVSAIRNAFSQLSEVV